MIVDGHDCQIQAPEDSDQFYFCTPLEESMGIKLTEAYPLEIPHRMRRKTGASGYAMHEGCWILTTRLLDVNVIKAHLKEFIYALPWASRTAGRNGLAIWDYVEGGPFSELILQIMDYLLGSQEILHLMLVFPFWAPKVPYFYWRTRFRKKVMLEQDELPDLDALNWQRAYCGLDYLYGASQAIRGRRRILAEIQTIKERFLASLRNE
ncbi:hypothetical protein APSETT444_003401 [Aspergillus pseudonomiae]